ncbi:16S rRNA (cytidine(1402)-2'-O)-methyltransferase [Sandarakinorhabdus cyanobacteriorum]|uniref:Ribosomal RNA small subunit methyltransferase I n=1 Tax=Sandarakinorhabdus cyanobacteriorum TaxID=1981098 RepID=A0A255YCT6_9SPHN|nr:16S rRNA (cytidine(1402)-2'-O)-methyltransferase [Sandarakinorhabdus cyanobacteriorum]OYQ27056.1 16S rRNA (cytidine(1402)-2'-O)-methyltransferase [Sandarakinorhabdus cyanobacteriorum]
MHDSSSHPPADASLPAGLYIVATPIGNLGDISPRALMVLRCASRIACEDTRVTAKLLNHFGIKARLTPYHDHNAAAVRPGLIADALAGPVALVSDAGTPLISDPGYKLVADARAAGVNVVAVPGPSAVIAALSIAGLPTDRFLFAGFLPAKAGARASAIAELAAVPATLAFYESGPRLAACLADLLAGLGNRPAAVGRELTKKFEEMVTGDLADLATRWADAPPKGELVVLVGPPLPAAAPEAADIDSALRTALASLSVKDAARQVAEALSLPRAQVYARALAIRHG